MGRDPKKAPVAWAGKPLNQYLDRLASGAATPGGGSAAAVTAAQGAALVAMVTHLTIGRPRYARHDDTLRAILAEAERLRAACLVGIDEDAAALGQLIAAYKLPKGTDEERQARDATLQTNLRAAAEAPLRLLRAAAAILPLCQRLLPIGNPATVSDLGVAAACAAAACRAAEVNVLINLGQVRDQNYVAAMHAELEQLRQGVPDRESAVLRAVHERLA